MGPWLESDGMRSRSRQSDGRGATLRARARAADLRRVRRDRRRAMPAPRSSVASSSRALDGPVVFVANHCSHVDTPVLLRSLPASWRRRTAVAAAADYFYSRRLLASAVSLAFGTVPLERARPRVETDAATDTRAPDRGRLEPRHVRRGHALARRARRTAALRRGGAGGPARAADRPRPRLGHPRRDAGRPQLDGAARGAADAGRGTDRA